MFDYGYIPALANDTYFEAAVACVISSHYDMYARMTCVCKRRAMNQRAMRLMFAAQA